MTNNLFETNNTTTTNGGSNQLVLTAKLTSTASQIANEILSQIMSDEQYADQIRASQTNHADMDKLIMEINNLEEVDVQFIKDEDEETIVRALKSQQSKRSRSKSKAMTVENYTAMMTAAIAENLLRKATGKLKGSAGGSSNSADPRFTDEELQQLAGNPADLTKAIRNVQSKKSIAKSKIDFDPESDRWNQLLEAEAQLKDLRNTLNGMQSEKTKEIMENQQAAQELLSDINPKDLKADEAKDMVAKLQQMLASQR